MAISKEQPMRPALDDCIDEIGNVGIGLNEEIQNRVDADSDLSDDIIAEELARELADTNLGNVDDAIKEVLPFSSFTSSNTVKKYIDDLGTAIKEVLPFASFDSTNTVKAYIDTLVNAVKEVLPFTSFDSEHTVKDYIDTQISSVISVRRIGKVSLTIAANDSDSETVELSVPFASTSDVHVFWELDDTYSDLAVTVSNETYTGFDISAVNADTVNPVTFTLFYIMIGV